MNYWVVFSSVVLFLLSIFVLKGWFIWNRRIRYTREPFAIVLFSIIIFLSILLIIVPLSINLLPWHVPEALLSGIVNNSSPTHKPSKSDYVLVFFAYAIGVYFILKQYDNWSGLKSIEQYQREKRGESSNILIDTVSEIKRIIKRETITPHHVVKVKTAYKPLEAVTDSLAWKDQAKDLLRFSSSSYAFDSEIGWHDKEKCWVGKNVNTGDLVFLYPSQLDPSDAEITSFIGYTHRFTSSERKEHAELIIATKNGQRKSVVNFNGKAIRFETEDSLFNNLIDFTDYINDLRKRVLHKNLPDSELNLESVYVYPRYIIPAKSSTYATRIKKEHSFLSDLITHPDTTYDGEDLSENVEEYLIQWLNDLSQRQLALLAGYGQGKSTTALMFTYHLLCKKELLCKRIPILIELRGTSPRNLTPLQMLGAWSAQYNINPQALLRLHISGRLVLIFEGFDEMALVGDADMRLQHFKTIWQFCYPSAKILITGRPNFFLDAEEMKAALGISQPTTDKPYCEAIRLAPFNLAQIKGALRAHKPIVRSEIFSFAKKNDRFLELISRPSLLHIVSVLWDKEKLSKKLEQLNSAYVMELFVRHSYRRQGLKELDSPDFMALTSLEREFFMIGIASYMAANKLPNQITAPQLNDLINVLINSMPESISTGSAAISGDSNIPLRDRLTEREYGVDHVQTDVRACGLLVDDPASPGTFQFGHKSFMEYLFASIVSEKIRLNLEKANVIFKATNVKFEDLIYLPVSIGFLAELLKSEEKENSNKRHNIDDSKHEENIERKVAFQLLKAVFKANTVTLLILRFLIIDNFYRFSIINLNSHRLVSKLLKYILYFLSPAVLLISLPFYIFALLTIEASFLM